MKIYSLPKSNWKLFCVIYYLKFNIIMLITWSSCIRGPFWNVIMCRLYLNVTILAFHLFSGLNVGARVELSRLTTKSKWLLQRTLQGHSITWKTFICKKNQGHNQCLWMAGDGYWVCQQLSKRWVSLLLVEFGYTLLYLYEKDTHVSQVLSFEKSEVSSRDQQRNLEEIIR